ncbi:MAG TPA: ribosome maturation factor RimP [Alphaproteobacteria bacterium]|nr:ribosome maturation factor RimP [Alphaproteobacteria bacterium]
MTDEVGQKPAFFVTEKETMAVKDRIETLISPKLDQLGYELVRVQLTGGGGRNTLQIMAERQDEAAMTVEDCEKISHEISTLLDVADPIASNYILEVSSPGIDRPLTRLKDFSRFSGFEAKLQLRAPVEGQRNFCGKLCGVEDGNVNLEVAPKKGETKRFSFPFSDVETARLVMNEALMKAALKAQEETETGARQ